MEIGDDTVQSNVNEQPDRVFWVLIAFLGILFFYHFTVPASKKVFHKKAIEQQIETVANAIEEQHKSLAKRYESLSSRLNEKLGIVWNVQAGEPEPKISDLAETNNDDSEDSSLLQQRFNDSESTVAKLQDEIAKLRESLGEVEGKMKFDQGTFCGDCIGKFKGGTEKMRCSERRDWLMENFDHSKEVATETIEKIDPDNCKKGHDDPSDHGTFCESCTGSFVGGNLRATCGQRRDYIMKAHGRTKEQATEAVMIADPANCIYKR